MDKHRHLPFILFINMAVPVFMMITGYNFAMSTERKTDGSFKQMYSKEQIWPKLVRFIKPFIPVYIIEIILLLVTKEKYNFLLLFFEGGIGPGSYYVPCLVQFLFVFPVIYALVKKNALLGIGVSGLVNLAFEIAIMVLPIPYQGYRLAILRYLLLISLGVALWVYRESRIKTWQLVTMFVIGLGYCFGIVWKDVDIGLFKWWKPTTFPIAFYIFPVYVMLARLFFDKHIPGKVGQFIATIGKASYHIFLTQMVYYHFELGGFIMKQEWYFAVPFNIVVSVTVGIIFYYCENRLGKKMADRRRTNL